MWQKEIEEHRFLIEEMVERVVFGPTGSMREWIRWGAYKTAEERDKRIAELRKRNPRKQYRGRDFDPWEDRTRVLL